MKILKTIAILTCAMTTVALAHEGVKDPTVMARMHLMKEIGAATKIVGDMAKGATDFDAQTARAAAEDLERHAAEIAAAFEDPADDPKSEALPAIWTDFADFTEIAEEMRRASQIEADDLVSEADLKRILIAIGRTCTDCHELYRE